MGNPVADDTILESRDNRTLADHLIERLGPGFSGENEIRHVTPGLVKINVWWSGEKMIAGLPAHTKRFATVASFRTWRSSRFFVAQGPAIKVELMLLAERVRFELTVLAYTRVPGVHLKPLGHLSFSNCSEKYVVLCKPLLPF
jgi:hypothetical protein